jgi:hypothetical protein
MKPVLHLLCTILLTLAVTLYGVASGAGAMTGGGPAFEMVICAEGGARTIHLGPDGTPVPQGHACWDCALCDHPPAAALPAPAAAEPCAAAPRSVPCTVATNRPSDTHNARPMPRGPPAVAPLAPHPVRDAAAIALGASGPVPMRPGQSVPAGGRPSKDAS